MSNSVSTPAWIVGGSIVHAYWRPVTSTTCSASAASLVQYGTEKIVPASSATMKQTTAMPQ